MTLEMPDNRDLSNLLKYFIQPTASVVFLRGGDSLPTSRSTPRPVAPFIPSADSPRRVKS
jgi:hypothetical protein